MRIQEDRHEGEPWLLWKIGNWTAIGSDKVKSIGVAWLFKENGKWVFLPRVTGEKSLFFNGIFFLRLARPLGIFFHFRPVLNQFLQVGAGWKLNGRLTVTFRIQSDASSAAGTTGPNYGQATGFDYGTH